jgi:CPA1 family monovalent cation:H+ antiporter
MVPYAAYVGADAIHASGVLAVVACGLMLGGRSADLFSPSVRLQVYAVWNAVVFVLNGVVFVLIGLQLSGIVRSLTGMTMTTLIVDGAVMSIVVAGLRIVWVFPGARLSYFIRHRFLHQSEPRPSERELFVFGWSGMRGVVSLAAAMALPATLPDGAPFPERGLVVFLAFSVVVFTLVVQGLTLGPLIRALGLAGGRGPACEEEEAHRIVIQAALAYVEETRGRDRAEYGGVYDDLAQHYREQLDGLREGDEETADTPVPQYRKHQSLVVDLLVVQRRALVRLRREGRINDQVLRSVERDLDLQQARLR